MFMTKIKIGVTVLLTIGLACGVTSSGNFGGNAFAQSESVENEACIGGEQKQDATQVGISYAQLGQKRDQLIKKFGDPQRVTMFVSGIESLEFQRGAHRMLVEVSPKSQQVIQIYYRKKTPFTDGEVLELLNRNAEGQRWIPAKEPGLFIRSDGGLARGCGNGTTEKEAAKFGDEYQFAVLSGSEVITHRPDVAAARKREVEQALQEVDAF